jgi:hypothetical protein
MNSEFGIRNSEFARRCAAAAALLVTLAIASNAAAGERYALVVTGASGGDVYAQKYAKWRASFVETLRGKFHYEPQRLIVLADCPPASAGRRQSRPARMSAPRWRIFASG